MKRYLTALAATFGILFLAAWAFVRYDYPAIALPEYELTKAHLDMISACNLGDIDIIGDSTSNADLIPSRIGPDVRVLGLGGETPVEIYYLVRNLMNCQVLPKTVILMFAASSFSPDPAIPAPQKTFFWDKAFEYDVISFRDAMDLLKYSKQFEDPLFVGPPSMFYIDYRLKAAAYATKFPPYFLPDLEDYVSNLRRGILVSSSTDGELYSRTIADDGHHFYGTQPYGLVAGKATLDHDADRHETRISPLTDFYFRRTIAALKGNGIKIFLLEPPRKDTSFAHYPPGLVEGYQKYLAEIQSSEPDVHLLGDGFPVWRSELFGDESHLNLRGSLIYSAMTRDALGAAGVSRLYDPPDLQPDNLFAAAGLHLALQTQAMAENGDSLDPAPDIALPELAYPVTASAWRYNVQPSGTQRSPGIRGSSVSLPANTYYAISLFIKNVDADSASLQVAWPGAIGGTVTWNFAQRAVSYSGRLSELNSGASLCPNGWVELFATGKTGPATAVYPGPMISLSASREASAIIYNMALERGLWPTNYCTLQPGEATVIPPPAGPG